MDLQSVVPAIIALAAGWLIGYLAMRGPKNAERARNEELREQKKSMEVWYEKAKSEFSGTFATLSRDALKENRGSFLDLVAPFQTKLQEFELKVNEVYRTEAAERNSLRGEIKNLVELN